MQISDPNTWNAAFVQKNLYECYSYLKETNLLVNKYLMQENYNAACAGIDRILNGLMVVLNGAIYDCRREISMFSWAEANIIAFGIKDVPEYKRKAVVRPLLEDAHDFATKDATKEMVVEIINTLDSGISLTELGEMYEPGFPEDTIDVLEQLSEHWF